MFDRPRELGSRAHAPPVCVLTVDDQPLFRDAARALIKATLGFDLMGEAESGDEVLELCRRVRPDLVLLDINPAGHRRTRDQPPAD